MRSPLAAVKKARRVVLGRLRDWYRRRRHWHGRTNYMVILESRRRIGRWVRATPDTYRFGSASPSPDSSVEPGATETIQTLGGEEPEVSAARRALLSTGADLAVVSRLPKPPFFADGSYEMVLQPVAGAITGETLDLVRGSIGPWGVSSAMIRVRDAGGSIAVLESSGVSKRPPPEPKIMRPIVVMVAAVPMHDVGGGSRPAQLALEMLNAGAHVVYVSIYPSSESVDLGLRFVHPHLEQHESHTFDWRRVLRMAGSAGWLVLEIPHLSAGRLVKRFRSAGWKLCYDVIDLWSDTALGNDWYNESFETELLERADLVAASAGDLVRDAEGRGAKAVLVPNAVGDRFFESISDPAPADFPHGEGPVLGYHGSLYGDWLDWSALESVAAANPRARVVVLGDDSHGPPPLPDNVHFLGLKPQLALPEYVARFDVGLLPFAVTSTTHAVSPLKVYEYLAAGVPVAAPPLRSLEGLAGVYTAAELTSAVDEALRASSPDREAVAAEHSWSNRVEQLLGAMGISPSQGSDSASVLIRHAEHYPDDRVLR